MFCRNCGKEMTDMAAVCVSCGVPAGKGNAFCGKCGSETNPEAVFCVKCGASLEAPAAVETKAPANAKSKLVAGLLAIFVGTLGVHNFYLGFTKKAVIQLLLTLLTCGFGSVVTGIWALVEGIMILAGNIDTDADGVKLTN